MRFKKKITKEELKVLLHDLESLEIKKTDYNKYHYDLLRNNLKDLGCCKKWGVVIVLKKYNIIKEKILFQRFFPLMTFCVPVV